MYDIAMTVAACLQSGTRADVAWLVDTDGLPPGDPSDAVVFTPGGGKIGSLAGGAFDGKLGDIAGRTNVGRLLDLEVSETDALIAGLSSTGTARCLLVPAEDFPPEVWDLARERKPFCVSVGISNGEVESIEVYAQGDTADADQEVQGLVSNGVAGSKMADNRVLSMFSAVARVIVVGSGPIASAIVDLAKLLGWDARVAGEASTAAGLIAPLSVRDMVVVAAHDLELAGAALKSALGSECGYVGSVGSRKMQTDRADWLAYRGETDLSRIHGPAGLDIGADSPAEIAVAVVAEAIASRSG